ncbi:MAG: division/cell wall cluster transcriptional repressor MraZ [Patescibacteria group bacterium]
MFIGKYEMNMDAKRRLPMPAKMREELGKTVIVTRGLDQCLFVYTQTAWVEFSEKLNRLPMSQASARNFARLLLSGAVEVDLDVLGRALVPEYLADHAGLKKQAVVIGAGGRIEIWDKTRWDSYQMSGMEQMGENATDLKEFGI